MSDNSAVGFTYPTAIGTAIDWANAATHLTADYAAFKPTIELSIRTANCTTKH